MRDDAPTCILNEQKIQMNFGPIWDALCIVPLFNYYALDTIAKIFQIIIYIYI